MRRRTAGPVLVGLLTGLLAALLAGLLVAAPAHAIEPTPASAARSEREPVPVPPDGGELIPFGADHGMVWDDKVQASVMSADTYVPSVNAAGLIPGHTGLRITIKITNGSPGPVDLTDATVTLNAGPYGMRSERLFDIENGVSTGFQGTVAPGRSASAVYGFSVAPTDLGLLDVELAPNLRYLPAIFEGAADTD